MVLRDRDANTDWDEESDGVLEERTYYCQNWRHDVVALIDDAGAQVQQVRYSAYGVPFGLPAGDVNSDGDVTSADDTAISNWISGSAYDVRGDMDLDGRVDNADRTALQSRIGDSLGRGVLALAVDHSGGGGGNRKGYAGYEGDFSRDGFWHVRHRVLDTELGRWTRRDPLGYVDGVNMYTYVHSRPHVIYDPFGLYACGDDDLADALECGSWVRITTIECVGFLLWWSIGCDCIWGLPDIVESLELITVPSNCEECVNASTYSCLDGCEPKDDGAGSYPEQADCEQREIINIGPGTVYNYPCPCTIVIIGRWSHRYLITIGVCKRSPE